MVRSKDDRAFFTGAVWMMASGSWQVRVQVEGAAGVGTGSVPVAAVALSTLKMQRGMGLVLGGLGVFLLVTMAGLVGARGAGGWDCRQGGTASAGRRRRGLVAMAGAAVVMGLMVWGGAKWWDVEAATYEGNIYRPMRTRASLAGDLLDLSVEGTPKDVAKRRPGRSNSDFLPDHGHLMHLYAIREPEMDAVFHLHPALVGPGEFRMALPAMPAGEYTLYGDVVHASGFPETLVARVTVPAGTGAGRAGGGRCGGSAAGDLGWGAGDAVCAAGRVCNGLGSGRMRWWLRGLICFIFGWWMRGGGRRGICGRISGWLGHAAFVKTDGTVFAHTHPEGSAAMAAVALANGGTMGDVAVGPEVDFPYGFPSAGRYRIFVQMKHGETVETGVFDASVE